MSRLTNDPSVESPASDSTTAPPAISLPGRIFYWFVCLVTVSLLAIAALRIVYHDGDHLLIWLNAFTRYIYLPAYPCVVWAVWKRRWWLAIANIAIVSLHMAWQVPDFVRDSRFDVAHNSASTAAPPSPSVRIFFANVRALNTEHDALLSEIKAASPDIIILVEFSWLWHMAYHHSPVFAAYPYGDGMLNTNLDTVNVFSRLPITNDRRDKFGDRTLQSFDVPISGQTLRIVGLHSPRPMDVRKDDYEGYWGNVVPLLLNEKGPLVVVGDFNATQYSRVYQQLTANHFRSAHEDRGRGYATTWPNGQYPLPPIRIDQALLSPEVECLSIREGEGRGSDHKPLILDVQLRNGR